MDQNDPNVWGITLKKKLEEIGTLALCLSKEIDENTEIKKLDLEAIVGKLIKFAIIGKVVTEEQIMALRKPLSKNTDLVVRE